jgi:sugar-specific transcriptional regulator TrmB
MNKTQIVNELKSIGLSDKESLIYVSAIQMDTFTLAEISKLSLIKRTSCYSVVDSLIQKGIISRVPGEKTIRYIAVDPISLLERKQEEMQRFEVTMKHMSMVKRSTQKSGLPRVEIFKGVHGIEQIHFRILESVNKELCSIIPPKFVSENITTSFRNSWVPKREKAGIKVRSLRPVELDLNGEIIKPVKQKNREVRFWPENLFINSMVFIWDNNVGFISTKKEGMSFIIISREFASVLQQCFNFIWKFGKKAI